MSIGAHINEEMNRNWHRSASLTQHYNLLSLSRFLLKCKHWTWHKLLQVNWTNESAEKENGCPCSLLFPATALLERKIEINPVDYYHTLVENLKMCKRVHWNGCREKVNVYYTYNIIKRSSVTWTNLVYCKTAWRAPLFLEKPTSNIHGSFSVLCVQTHLLFITEEEWDFKRKCYWFFLFEYLRASRSCLVDYSSNRPSHQSIVKNIYIYAFLSFVFADIVFSVSIIIIRANNIFLSITFCHGRVAFFLACPFFIST